MERYPVKRTIYNKTVGALRVVNIAAVLGELGFKVIKEAIENHDVDVWVYKGDELVLVIEVLNWRRDSYMAYARAKSILKHFSNPKYKDSRKLLIFSFLENIEDQLTYFKDTGIDFLALGFQTQPLDYSEFYREQREAFGMKPDNEETREILKRELIEYLNKIRLVQALFT